MIEVLYTHFKGRIAEDLWDHYIKKVPLSIQEKTGRYKRWQDRQAGLFGKLLLLEGLRRFGYPSDCLNNISFNRYGRPFLEGAPDFNISHSGECAVCSITDRGRVGIDIEGIRDIEISDFERYMTEEELESIRGASDGGRIFFEYWTIRESVAKADGRGLSISPLDINIFSGKATLQDQIWLLRRMEVSPEHVCHLATDEEHAEVRLSEVKF